MRPSPALLRDGFLRRSIQELRRQTNVIISLETLRDEKVAFPMHRFSRPDNIADCKVMGDGDIGGFTTSHLDFSPANSPQSGNTSPCARFHGKISIDLPKDNPQVVRTGFAGWRTWDQKRTIFGRTIWDLDPYTYIAMRVRSDGRKYFVNLQTESIDVKDIHQHRLLAHKPGKWETVHIRIDSFVRTNMGRIIEPQNDIIQNKVRTIGVSLTDRVPGPFELWVQDIWASSDMKEFLDQEKADDIGTREEQMDKT